MYASKRKVGKRYPNGTVIVKTIQPSGRTGKPFQVAVMRKTNGKWRYDEYEGIGHVPQMEIPEVVSERVLDWMDANRLSTAAS